MNQTSAGGWQRWPKTKEFCPRLEIKTVPRCTQKSACPGNEAEEEGKGGVALATDEVPGVYNALQWQEGKASPPRRSGAMRASPGSPPSGYASRYSYTGLESTKATQHSTRTKGHDHERQSGTGASPTHPCTIEAPEVRPAADRATTATVTGEPTPNDRGLDVHMRSGLQASRQGIVKVQAPTITATSKQNRREESKSRPPLKTNTRGKGCPGETT